MCARNGEVSRSKCEKGGEERCEKRRECGEMGSVKRGGGGQVLIILAHDDMLHISLRTPELFQN